MGSHMRIVGLTGGIACGKSTVAALIKKYFQLPVIDADVLARQVLQPGQPALAAVAARWPTSILSDGTLNRPWLAQVIFHDAAEREALRNITHPFIADVFWEETRKLEATDTPLVIYEAALLIESDTYTDLEGIIVVDCSEETQMERLMRRNNYSRVDAQARINAQVSRDHRLKVSDWIIDTENQEKMLIQTGWAVGTICLNRR